MFFADIHCHALAAVDDGAKDDRTMFSMLDAAYADNVRILCFTPHWQPSVFGDNRAVSDNAFLRAREYIKRTGRNMSLFLANELRYDAAAASWLSDRSCRTLGGTRSVLVDFSAGESAGRISDGLTRLLGAGYRPILAHTERYRSLAFSSGELKRLRSDGVRIQVNADSILGKAGFGCRMRSHSLLDSGLADIVASDSHGIDYRPTMLTKAFEAVSKKYGNLYAAELFKENPAELLAR